MTVTLEQIQNALAQYIDIELAPKAQGLTKFMLYFTVPSLPTTVAKYYRIMQESQVWANCFDDAGNVILETVRDQAVHAIEKSGKIFIKPINYFVDVTDIDKLYSILKAQ
jgi:hypothetical protein